MKSRKEKTVEQNAKNFHEKFYENNYAFMHYTMKDDIMKYFKREDRKFHHYLLSHGIKSERRGNNHIFYDYNKISISYVYDLFDLLKKIYEYKTKKDGNGKLVHDLIFRGHANANYQLHSSLIRDDNHLENEDEYYFDTIKSNPQAFRNARYHLDYLKTIQHYRGVSRIMDIGTNVLITIYFAVEKIDNDKHKENMGELIIFDKNKIDNSGEEPNEIKPHSVINHNIKQRKTNIINPKVEVKRFNSDTVEILASLAALKKNLKDEIKKDAYEVINECNNKCSSKTNLIEEFNKRESVKN